jgi:hypothetical protein
VAAITDIVFSLVRSGELSTELQLVLAISREPAFAPEYEVLRRKVEEYLGATMTILGSRNPEWDARITRYYTRGFVLEQLARPRSPVSRAAFKAEAAYLLRRLLRR